MVLLVRRQLTCSSSLVNDSLDFKKMALVFRRSFKSVNDQLYSSLIRFLVSHGISGHYEW